VAGEGSCPRFRGFYECSAGLGSGGPWWWFGLVSLGRRGGDGGGGELPGSPGGSPPRFPALCHAGVSSSLLVGKLIKAEQATGLYRELVELNRDAYLPNLRVPGRVPTSTP